MNPDTKSLQDADFLFRRTQEALSDWTLVVPVLFAFGVLILVALFARQNKGNGPLFAALIVGAIAGGGVFGILSMESRSRLAVLLGAAAVCLILTVAALARQMRDWVPAGFMATLSFAYVAVALLFKSAFSWWVILAPVLAVALVYVGLMYFRDSRTVHAGWASFLGACRCLVYGILAFVFLLPGCQTWDTTESHSKVIIINDVSGSMYTVDDIPEVNQDPTTLPSRQDKVIEMFTGKASRDGQPRTPFIQALLEKSPLSVYRFGSFADDKHVLNLLDGQALSEKQWADFLKPDPKQIVVAEKDASGKPIPLEDQIKERARLRDLFDGLKNGTNVGGSALQVAKLETSSFVQAIIIVSDGQSNLGGADAVKEFLARVNNPKRKIAVFTIGVGEYRQPVSIRIEDLQAPEVASPHEKFPVRVPVVASGLPDEEFQVVLEAQRIKDKDGKPTPGEKKFALGPLKGKLKGVGDDQHDTAEFIIDVQALKQIKADKDEAGLLEGTWEFVAKVPRHANEAFPKPEHVSDPPTQVLVQKRRLRVLLFAGGPNRDYQFVRTLLYREVLDKRMDLAVYLQTGRGDDVNQDVDSEWLLTHFPDKLGPDDPRDKHSSLNEYDVIIAFDPDWTALDSKQLKNLKEWVGTHAGGIIFVAGPVHTFHLSRKGTDLSALTTIFPVVLKDSRLHSITHDTNRPYYLNFTAGAKNFEFLKLDENGLYPTSGWKQFFWRDEKAEPGKDAIPKRGFYNYYPVEKIKPDSTVIATFAGPPSSRINDGKDEQPYFVSMRYGSGKTFYMGSMEMWRLRPFKEAYHERFWIKLARHVAAATTMKKKYGSFPMGRFYNTGTINFEVQVKGADLQPLPRDANPTVLVKRPASFDPKLDPETPESLEVRPKNTEGEWQGWFTGSFKVRTPGEYEFKLPIPGTTESISHRFTVRQPNPEMENVRNNFNELYRLSSDAGPILSSLPQGTRMELERLLKPPADADFKDQPEAGKSTAKLFFNIKDAPAIIRCLKKVAPNKEATKGKLIDLWDSGLGREGLIDTDTSQVSAFLLFLIGPAVILLFAAGILFLIKRPIAAGVVIGCAALIALGVFLYDRIGAPSWALVPLDMSFVLAVVVTLLSVEWLTRKLLKLA
jgi:hypothetical protein